jgi:hypothetical protein
VGRLFLDLDGVLADFDEGARRILGTDNSYKWEWIHGTENFWGMLNAAPEFFFNLPMMPDARYLWSNVEYLKPTILTALPKSGAQDVDRQKRLWVAEHLGLNVPVITCLTHEKPAYCEPGDVLVDDRTVNAKAWTGQGGVFVHHETAHKSLGHLNGLFNIGAE